MLEMILGAAHWVGAITRDTEGSYMQLQERVCPLIKAGMWKAMGAFAIWSAGSAHGGRAARY